MGENGHRSNIFSAVYITVIISTEKMESDKTVGYHRILLRIPMNRAFQSTGAAFYALHLLLFKGYKFHYLRTRESIIFSNIFFEGFVDFLYSVD